MCIDIEMNRCIDIDIMDSYYILNEAQIETAAAQTPSRKVCCRHTSNI